MAFDKRYKTAKKVPRYGELPTRKKPTKQEHLEAVAFVERCKLHLRKYPELEMLAAIPNGGHRYRKTGVELKAEGVRRGYPDYTLDVARGGYHGLRIELKTQTGKASREQSDYIDRLRKYGYRAEVCRGSDEAWRTVVEYLES